MRSGGSGDEGSLPNSFGWEFILFVKHISTGEHSLHIHGGALVSYIYISCFMMTSSNGNMFCVTGFCAGNSPVTAGNSPVTGEFPSHRPVTRSFDVFFALRLNKRLSKQSRRRWFETPSRSIWRHCNVVPNSDPVIRAAVGSFGVQRVTPVQFRIGETGQIGGFRALWKELMASNLAHCSTLITIPWNQLYFASSGSSSLWCQIIHK